MAKNTINKLFVLVFLLCASNSLAARGRKIELTPSVLSEVNRVLDESTAFQTALHSQNEENIKKQLKALNISIQSAVSRMNEFNVTSHEIHIRRILQSTKNYLESYENIDEGNKKTKFLKKMFSQLVQLVRAYKVDKKYKIYFCSRDSSEWIQKVEKSWRAQNPIHPETFAKCGKAL